MKQNKTNIIYVLTILAFGVGFSIYGFLGTGEAFDYISGFGVGLSSVAICFLIRTIILLSNPDKMKAEIIKNQDERNLQILTKSYAITFRISIFIEAISSIVFAFLHQTDLSIAVGFAISIQLFIYLISYTIISHKI